jgi:hypothetical protein
MMDLTEYSSIMKQEASVFETDLVNLKYKLRDSNELILRCLSYFQLYQDVLVFIPNFI